MVKRLSPLVVELEQADKPLVVISHLSTLQVLLSYFRATPVEECWRTDVPQNVLVELTPSMYGYQERQFRFVAEEGGAGGRLVEQAVDRRQSD